MNDIVKGLKEIKKAIMDGRITEPRYIDVINDILQCTEDEAKAAFLEAVKASAPMVIEPLTESPTGGVMIHVENLTVNICGKGETSQ